MRPSRLLSNYKTWPWPVKLPLKKDGHWFHPLRSNRSIADETRSVVTKGDLVIVAILAWSAYRLVSNYDSGAYRTRLSSALVGYPPAIVANNFNFEKPEANRRVTREALDNYRDDVVGVRATASRIEDVIFKY
jgi:hypothetical protein